MVTGARHWTGRDPFDPFLLGWGERKELSSEPQMAPSNTRGVTGVSGDKPQVDRSN